MSNRSGRTGFTLIELLVALLITSIVASQVLSMFVSQLQVFNSHRRTVDAQNGARLISDLVLQDVRMAGFMMPAITGVSSVDGGNANADTLCVSDPGVLNDAMVDQATGKYDGAGLALPIGSVASTVTLTAAEMDIDSDGDDDFVVGQGIIISEGTRTHCARITAIVGGLVDFTPATPGGFALVSTSWRAVPAIIYQHSANQLTRNGLLISDEVDDFQIEFAVDANNDGEIGSGEFPIHDLNSSVPSLVKGLQLSVMTRAAADDPNFVGGGRKAMGNRAGSGAQDNVRRRVISVNAALRNML